MSAANIVLPLILALCGASMAISKKPLGDAFVRGAKEGLSSCVSLVAPLVLLVCSISMFNASGAADFIAAKISPALSKLGVPGELAALLVVRPISGSASTALANDLFTEYGADSFAGLCASVIMGSSDTMLYIITLYMSSVGIKKTRHTIPVAAAVMILCTVLSCALVQIFLM